jgi:hypothetical protein
MAPVGTRQQQPTVGAGVTHVTHIECGGVGDARDGRDAPHHIVLYARVRARAWELVEPVRHVRHYVTDLLRALEDIRVVLLVIACDRLIMDEQHHRRVIAWRSDAR